MDLGKRLKQLRMKNGLTLEELASRTELSRGFLSQLERNIASPSISTLEDIAEVLGVSMAEFFSEAVEKKVVFTEQDYFVDEKEEMTITYVVPSAQKNQMEPLLVELTPGGTSQIILPHAGEEMGYVLQGKISLMNLTARTSHTVKKGETFYIKGDSRHCLVNNGKSAAKILWISTPPIF